MKLYVAAASAEMERAKRVMDALRALGHEITFDWIQHVQLTSRAYPNVPESGLPESIRRGAALDDFLGIVNAEGFVFLAPTSPTKGAWWELGVASALRMGAITDKLVDIESPDESYPVFIVGPAGKTSIMTSLAGVYVDDDDRFLSLMSDPDMMHATIVEHRRNEVSPATSPITSTTLVDEDDQPITTAPLPREYATEWVSTDDPSDFDEPEAIDEDEPDRGRDFDAEEGDDE